MLKKNLIIFIDRQNVYKNARDAFFSPSYPSYYGQIDPLKLADLICQRTSATNVNLKQVRIYRGRPDSTKDPQTYKAHMKQCLFWQSCGVEVITRPLRYLPSSKPQEKGIDVALAVDYVTMAVDGEYHIGVVFSTDTDLRPALEFVYKKFAHIKIETVSWRSPCFKKWLSIPTGNIWCHFLDINDYYSVADTTNYSCLH